MSMLKIILIPPHLGVASPKPSSKAKPNAIGGEQVWMGVSGIILILFLVMGVLSQLKIRNLQKKLLSETFKNKEMKRQYKMAVETIAKMEKNPDLIHSREFNLDYLRMRMSEDVFHFSIVNQIKVKVKEQITIALRPTQLTAGEQNPNTGGGGRQIDATFDVEYDTTEPGSGKSEKRVLFRIEIRLMKLPTQTTSATINDIINCLETYLSPSEEYNNWQPTIQGRIVHIDWDQKAKPTPLLVLEQSTEGVNVTFRTKRPLAGSSGDTGFTSNTGFNSTTKSRGNTKLKK